MTGLILDIGDSSTTVTPIFDGCEITHATKRSPVGGQALLELLISNLEANGVVSLRTSYEREFVGRDILRQKSDDNIYTLPDGGKITVSNEQEESIDEAFFSPPLASERPDLFQLIENCVADCEVDLRETLKKNLILAGGVTLLPNFEDLLRAKLTGTRYKIRAKPDRMFASW